MNHSNSAAPPPPVFASGGRREHERSEGDRSPPEAKTGADPGPGPRPNPEVVAQAKRRRFTPAYKLDFLRRADLARASGEVGALLRREGLYSSVLTTWRRERDAGALQGLASHKRGPKLQTDPFADVNRLLRIDNLRLTEQLRKAETIIDIQKKIAELFGQTASSSPASGTI